MRVSGRAAVVAMVLAIVASSSLEAQDARVAKVLERGRLALAGGTERALPATFAIKGIRTVIRNRSRPLPFEIHAQLPDKFVWTENPGSAYMVRRGFDGSRLITDEPQNLAGSIPNSTGATATERADVRRDTDQLSAVRAEFSKLTLGLFATSFRSAPLTFSDVQGGEAANAIGVASRDGFGATLVFDRTTGLPAWLGYREATTQGSATRRWVYEDYRDVEGRMVPHQLTWLISNPEGAPLSPVAEYKITEYRFDLPIDPKVFRK